MEEMMLRTLTHPSERNPDPSVSVLSRTVSGIVALDKPEGRTSFSIVNEIKRLFDFRKVGHCGTLDPFATGLFLICLNRATRIADQLLELDKVYRFGVRFGLESDTLDRTGRLASVYEGPPVSEGDLQRSLDRFRGVCEQQVPRYAAVKVRGRRLYALSRKGIEIELPRRNVNIYRIKLLSYDWPDAGIEVNCSKGTYVRQLAADIGRDLGCGAYVTELRRLTVGAFSIDRALSFEEFKNAMPTCYWQGTIMSMNDALAHLPSVSIDPGMTLKRLLDGNLDPALEMNLRERFSRQTTPVRLVAALNNELIALWWPHGVGEKQHRLRVFGSDITDNSHPL
jgi:tRNA pseudouridine55 synthase